MIENKKEFKLISKKNPKSLLPNALTIFGVCLGLSSIKFAMDLNYHLKATEFLNYFNSSVNTKNGLDMLIYQALMSLDIWYNKNLSLSIDVGDLKRKLIEKYYDE